jgi:DNA repair protein RecN (Recombination protein N)
MLATKCVLMSAENVPTVIFDEVDTGVSGKTSHKIGIKLREISKYSQTFCVTHSAQVAATAHNHYKIEKNEIDGRSQTGVNLLDEVGRVNEIARIMGGVQITEKIIETAQEMILSAQIDT